MELAIPIIALGTYFVASSKSKSSYTHKKESFTNMGQRKSSLLPNTNIPPQNYPVMNETELVDTIQEYPNPNVATSTYLNQNEYESNQRAGNVVGNNIQEIYSLNGNYMDSSEFKHNNMVPFNGGKVRGQIYNNDNAEAILDTYSGTGSQMIKKIEQAPLFAPQDNVQWTHGAPNQSDFYQSRVNPAMRNNMVKPFESQQVGPGLGKGYTTEGSGGFNSGMEDRDAWLPKTVDELRTETNPKEEYSMLGHEGPGQSVVANRGLIGKVEKYNPDTYFINTQDRWLTTTGAEKAPQMIPQELFKTSHREDTTTAFTGTPSAQLKTASYVPKLSQTPRRPELATNDVGHSSAGGRGPHGESVDKRLKSHTNFKNNRSENCQPVGSGGMFSSAIGAAIAPIMDALRGSRKEEYTCNARVYGNSGSEVPGNYVQTDGDVPGTTVRETTLFTPHGYINNQTNGGGYETNTQQPISNQRDSTTDCGTFYSASGGAGTKHGNRTYEADYRATTNVLKEKTLHGRTNHGNSNLFSGTSAQGKVSMSKLESDLENNRTQTPGSLVYNGPSVETFGKINVPQYNNQCIGCERIAPDLLSAFKENPFTHSLTYAV
tara:strand:- start:619 stop:2427 length:1809 start_codon:yes stop_codon:yes gene_type:complete